MEFPFEGWYRCLDALATAHLHKEPQSRLRLLRTALFRQNISEQLRAILNLADFVTPGIGESVSRLLVQKEGLPIRDAATLTLFDYGYEQTVFLSEIPFGGATRSVVKFHKDLTGQPLNRILEHGTVFRSVHEETKNLMGEFTDIVVPEHVIVSASHLAKNAATLVIIQPFIEGPIVDYFEDISTQERQQLILEYPFFGRQVQQFSKVSDELFEQKGLFMDILGSRNLAIVEKMGRPSLQLMESHLLRGRADMENKEIYEKFIDRLVSLRDDAVDSAARFGD